MSEGERERESSDQVVYLPLFFIPGLTADPFTKQMLSQLAAIVDPKPGRVFWEILPIVQSPFPVVTPKINVDVSG